MEPALRQRFFSPHDTGGSYRKNSCQEENDSHRSKEESLHHGRSSTFQLVTIQLLRSYSDSVAQRRPYHDRHTGLKDPVRTSSPKDDCTLSVLLVSNLPSPGIPD